MKARSLEIKDPMGKLPNLKTPMVIYPTEFGILPYITPDRLQEYPLYFSVGDFFDDTLPSSKTVLEYLGLGPRWIFLGPGTDFFNFEDGPGKGGVKIHGRNSTLHILTPMKYQEIINFIQPNGLIQIYSQVPFWASCRQEKLRRLSATDYVIKSEKYLSFTNYNSKDFLSGLFVQIGELTPELLETLKGYITSRPIELPRIVLFDGHPDDLKKLIEIGFDLFIPTLPNYYTRNGHAFTFPLDAENTNFDSISIDLRSMEYEHDQKPIVEGCNCTLCKNHSRSYIHHLLNVHEMLADTLLNEHNLKHYQRYIEIIRSTIG